MKYLKTSKPSFLFLIACMILISSGLHAQEKNLDELLELDITELLDIEIVSASKIMQKISEVPATVRVISASTIKSNGYFTLEDVLADLPGFQFRNILGLNSYVFLRGVPNQNNLILVLIDGIQINELNSGGFYGGGQYNLSEVDRIEVVYGPASVLYGTNAISGIINIITKKANDNQGLNVSYLSGSFDTRSINTGYGFYSKQHDFGLRLSAMYKTSEKADLRGDKGDQNWSENMENFENDFSLNLKLNYKNLRLGVDFLNKQTSASTYYKSIGTEYNDRGTLWNIRFINTYLKYNYKFSKKWLFSLKMYFRDATVLNNSIQIINETSQIGYYRPNDLIGFETFLHYNPSNQIKITGGIVYESERLASGYSKTYSNSPDEKPPHPLSPPKETNTLYSIYIQAQYFIFKSINLTAGARYDKSSVYGKILTPQFGLVYNQKNISAKLLYMEAFRAPKPWDYYSGIGNLNLKPEEMRSIEFNTSYNISDKIQLSLSLYKNTLNERLSRENIDFDWRWINKGHLYTKGVETTIEYHTKSTKLYFNYTYNNSYDENRDEIPEIAKHSANAGFSYFIKKNIKLNIRGNYLGKRINPQLITSTGTNHIKESIILHSTLSLLDVCKFNFYFIIRNLLNAEYYHTSNRSTVERYRQPQRTILLKMEFKF